MDYYRSFDRSLAFRFLWQEYEPQLPEDWKLDSHFARNCFDTHRVEPAWDRLIGKGFTDLTRPGEVGLCFAWLTGKATQRLVKSKK